MAFRGVRELVAHVRKEGAFGAIGSYCGILGDLSSRVRSDT
jgi:hypothetical protein